MSKSEKIAISLPEELLRKVEALRVETGETRSALVRRAIRLIFEQRERAMRVSEYVEGYRTRPETPDEIAAAEASAADLLAQEPWE